MVEDNIRFIFDLRLALLGLFKSKKVFGDAIVSYSFMGEDSIWGRRAADAGIDRSIIAFWDDVDRTAAERNPGNALIADYIASHRLFRLRDQATARFFESVKIVTDFEELMRAMDSVTFDLHELRKRREECTCMKINFGGGEEEGKEKYIETGGRYIEKEKVYTNPDSQTKQTMEKINESEYDVNSPFIFSEKDDLKERMLKRSPLVLQKIYPFLQEHKGQAFSVPQIARATGVNELSVRTKLAKIHKVLGIRLKKKSNIGTGRASIFYVFPAENEEIKKDDSEVAKDSSKHINAPGA